MKTIVVYKSNTGFTEKYARWIGEELGCEAVELKKTGTDALKEYDLVIYGGGIMAGVIDGYEKVRTAGLRDLVVFGVGMSMPGDTIMTTILAQNQVEREHLFYFEGGYAPEKLGFIKRLLMNMIRKSVEKKAEKTAEDRHMLESFKGVDRTDRASIAPLVALCKTKMGASAAC